MHQVEIAIAALEKKTTHNRLWLTAVTIVLALIIAMQLFIIYLLLINHANNFSGSEQIKEHEDSPSTEARADSRMLTQTSERTASSSRPQSAEEKTPPANSEVNRKVIRLNDIDERHLVEIGGTWWPRNHGPNIKRTGAIKIFFANGKLRVSGDSAITFTNSVGWGVVASIPEQEYDIPLRPNGRLGRIPINGRFEWITYNPSKTSVTTATAKMQIERSWIELFPPLEAESSLSVAFERKDE